MALRWMDGGSEYDIASVHGVHVGEVLYSVWEVVDRVNSCKALKIMYPTSHEAQKEIAKGFEKKSWVGFRNCAGCIDGMLVWINKPSKLALVGTNIGEAKKIAVENANMA